MKTVTRLLCSVLCIPSLAMIAGACDVEPDERIGAERARADAPGEGAIDQHPWQVSIQRAASNGDHLCSGAIIDKDLVLTAAHCIDGLSLKSFQVVAGVGRLSETQPEGQVRGIDRAAVHPDYVGPEGGSDLVLLKLDAALDLSGAQASAIGLAAAADLEPVEPEPEPEPEPEATTGGQMEPAPEPEPALPLAVEGFSSGWDLLLSGSASDMLQSMAVTLLSNDEASAAYELELGPEQLVTEPVESSAGLCHRDGGAPMVVETLDGPRLAGIASWATSCDDAERFQVHARMPSFAEWLDTESNAKETPIEESSSCRSGNEDRCGQRAPDGCRCDELCVEDGGCCADYQAVCEA
ncbi:MAG: trypsin-like serine protease [Nannocystaceae bacterium]